MTIKYKKVNQMGQLDSIKKTDTERGAYSASIPLDPANTDYAEYLEWVAAGNTAEAAD
jgi:hypothetical protein